MFCLLIKFFKTLPICNELSLMNEVCIGNYKLFHLMNVYKKINSKICFELLETRKLKVTNQQDQLLIR